MIEATLHGSDELLRARSSPSCNASVPSSVTIVRRSQANWNLGESAHWLSFARSPSPVADAFGSGQDIGG